MEFEVLSITYIMAKPSLFKEEDYNALRHRLENLTSTAPRQWGKMDASQMMAHLNIPLEVGLGKQILPAEFSWPMNALVKWYCLRQNEFKSGLPTAKTFVVSDHRQFEAEKQRLLNNLQNAFKIGLHGPWAKHNIFGNLTPEQWGRLTYMHLDHHLRQFGG